MMKLGSFVSDINKYCTPAQVYVVLAVFSILVGFFKNFKVLTLGINVLLVLVWAWILNWLCSKGLRSISWLIVLLPFIVLASSYYMAQDIAFGNV